MKLNGIIKELKESKCEYFKVENDLLILTGIYDSYRGMYEYPALGYVSWSYGNYNTGIGHKLKDLIKLFEEMAQSSISGWKGGEFYVDDDLEVFVSNAGVSTGKYISKIDNDGYYVNLRLSNFVNQN